jgi:aminoglycoside phosphotransferase (APT) family kinase protein
MHDDEIDTDAALVRRLLAAQFPQWSDLAIEPVRSNGTDNAMYRLGEDMAVRMPRIHWATGAVEKEQAWLPKLAPHLPLAIPVPLAKGAPGEGYPWPWSVCRWLEGRNATPQRLADLNQAAEDLAAFIRALQSIDATGGPHPGRHNAGRGVPLPLRDGYTRDAIKAAENLIDTSAAATAWETDMATPPWTGRPVWIHGDLSAGNLLAMDGRLSAVIDFGCLGVGDPACDLIVAWSLFGGTSRAAFRTAMAVDDATWARGRGWALSAALVALPYYRERSPAIAAGARRVIDEVLADHKKT